MNRVELEWQIREVSSEQDWEQALELLNAVYVGEGFTTPEDARQTFSKARLEGNGDLLVADEAQDRIVGAVLLVNGNSQLQQIADEGEAEFRLLAVAVVARGRGIGRRLIQECLRRARRRGARRMVLSTQPSQRAAHGLYEDLGFARNPERDWQTASGSERWVYAAELD